MRDVFQQPASPPSTVSNRADTGRVLQPPGSQPASPQPPTKEQIRKDSTLLLLPSLPTSSPTLGSIRNAEFKILSEFCKGKATNFSPMIKSFDDQSNIFQPTSKNV